MKKISIICFVLLLVMTMAANAEEVPVGMSYHDALSALQETNVSLASLSEKDCDENTQEIIQFCQYQLALAEAGLTLVTPEEILLQDDDLFSEEAGSEVLVEEEYSVPPTYIEDLGCGQSYKVYRKGNYVCIESSVYDAELLNQLEFVRIEVSMRPEPSETMILLTQLRYEGLMTSSNRYLIYSDATEAQSIFRRTFSSDTEYRINLEAWADGEYYEWDDKLLYPRVSE